MKGTLARNLRRTITQVSASPPWWWRRRNRWEALVFGFAIAMGAFIGHERSAAADPAFDAALKSLSSSSDVEVLAGVRKLGALENPAAIPVLDALCDDRLKAGPDGRLYIKRGRERSLRDPFTGDIVSPQPNSVHDVELDNEIRGEALPILASLKLASPDPMVRLAAADELAKRGNPDAGDLLRKAFAREAQPKVRNALALALARADLQGTDAEKQLAALDIIRRDGDETFVPDLARVLTGTGVANAAALQGAARNAQSAIEGRQRMVDIAGGLFHGLSLASVLLLSALGLAVTFGLLGVINMAHGEMLMIGSYTTYAIQTALGPAGSGYYLFLAVPAAMLVTFLVGVLLERTIIRFLYGRPLETLLATWGISLVLIQIVRLLFGAQNVAVANPDWLAGGMEALHGLVLPWSRIGVILFGVLVSLGVWVLLQRTRLGLQVRAVTQNRSMAACMGIRSRRIDTWMFGLGSAIAGLGGVALSQLGNVGPELGQAYIIDSFMVVVLGGVGRLAGTIVAAVGLGLIHKSIEPFAGAVLGKIVVLVLIIVFIQRRPQGIFAIKGRVDA